MNRAKHTEQEQFIQRRNFFLLFISFTIETLEQGVKYVQS